MKFRIKQFEFDSEQQLLTQHGQVITLNEKPAQMLALFVLEPNTIHSKQSLLDRIWRGRVVGEQVVQVHLTQGFMAA